MRVVENLMGLLENDIKTVKINLFQLTHKSLNVITSYRIGVLYGFKDDWRQTSFY